MIHTDPTKRHEFVYLFDVTNGNPNGDPDAGNLPRIDPETMRGLVTDVCLKRKVRDYLQMVRELPIFIQSEAALNTLIHEAFKEIGLEPLEVQLTEPEQENEELTAWLEGKAEEGLLVEGERLTYSGEAQRQKDIRQLLTEGLDGEQKELAAKLRDLAKRLGEAAKQRKGRSITRETRKEAQKLLCGKYFDIRMFGAVLSTGLNAGQVRGPVQLTFARSEDPILPLDLSITRSAITRESDRRRKETEMARKPIVPYGLYRAHGFFNPFLAEMTGVSEEDLKAFWEAMEHLFDLDRSAARGEMAVRGLYVLSHEDAKGNAPAHKLFEHVHVKKSDDVETPRKFSDYEVRVDKEGLPKGVTLTELVTG